MLCVLLIIVLPADYVVTIVGFIIAFVLFVSLVGVVWGIGFADFCRFGFGVWIVGLLVVGIVFVAVDLMT